MGDRTEAYRILVRKPQEKRPLGRHRHIMGGLYIKHLQEMGWRGMDWIDLAQDTDRLCALVNMIMNLRVS